MESKRQLIDRSAIQKIMENTDKTSQEIIQYGVFAPKIILKSATKAKQSAINKITYGLPLDEIIKNISSIMDEITLIMTTSTHPAKGELDKQLKALRDQFIKKRKIEKFSAFDHLELAKDIEYRTRYIHDLRKPETIVKLSDELVVWLDAAYFFLSIHTQRQAIHEIDQNKQNAIDLVALKEGKEALPVLICILEDMKKRVGEEQALNNEVIDYTLHILNQSNDMQYKDFKQAIDEIKKQGLLKEIVPSLKALVEKVSQLVITPELIPLAKELIIWFEGFYVRALNRSKSWTPDGEDIVLRAATFNVVSKLSIAEFYHEAAFALKKQLADLDQPIKPQNHLENQKEEEPKSDLNDLEKQKEGEPKSELTLSAIKGEKLETRLTHFITYLNTHTLNSSQEADMQVFKEQMVSKLGSYANQKWYGFWRMPNADLVDLAIIDIMLQRDPVTNIKRLYKLWNDLQNRNSDQAFEKTEDLLNSCIEILEAKSTKTLRIISFT